MQADEMKRIQEQTQGKVCHYCLAHPEHIASVQQIEFLRKEMEKWRLLAEERFYRIQALEKIRDNLKEFSELLYKGILKVLRTSKASIHKNGARSAERLIIKKINKKKIVILKS